MVVRKNPRNNRNRHLLQYIPVVLILLSWNLTGCKVSEPNPVEDAIPAPAPEQKDISPKGVRSHLWSSLTAQGNEEPGFGMYTYVLVNYYLPRSDQPDEVWQRYDQLVEAIRKSTPERPDWINPALKKEFNLFLIPYVTTTLADNRKHEELISRFSRRLLTQMVVAVENPNLRERLSTNPGPFLISSKVPLSQVKPGQDLDLFYVDLSRANPAAMNEVIAVYKRRLTKEELEGIAAFRSFRLNLLNLILDLDDYILIVRTAAVSWFGEE